MKTVFPDNIRCAAVISPAGMPNKSELQNGVDFLKACGLKVKIMPHAFGSDSPHASYLAASDEERASDFTQAYCDDEVDIIFSSRGGYGCARMLPLINWKYLKTFRPKIVAGYSDLTSLFFAMTAFECGTPLASVMTAKLHECPEPYLKKLSFACSGKQLHFDLETIQSGNASGSILAGNLTVAASCAGTQYMPDISGKILILEEVGEDIYRIDRLLNQLRLSGILGRCAGLIGGYFSGCGKDDVKQLLNEYSRFVNGPVLADFPYGHEFPFEPFMYNRNCVIDGKHLIIN